MGPYEHVRIKHDPGQSVLGRTLVRLGGSDAPPIKLLGAPPSAKQGQTPPALPAPGGGQQAENVLLLGGIESETGQVSEEGGEMELERVGGVSDGEIENAEKQTASLEAGPEGQNGVVTRVNDEQNGDVTGVNGRQNWKVTRVNEEQSGEVTGVNQGRNGDVTGGKEGARWKGGGTSGRRDSPPGVSGGEAGGKNEVAAGLEGLHSAGFASGLKRSRDFLKVRGARESSFGTSEGGSVEKRPRLVSGEVESLSEESVPEAELAVNTVAAPRNSALENSVDVRDTRRGAEGGPRGQETNTPGKATECLNKSGAHQNVSSIEERRDINQGTIGPTETTTLVMGVSSSGAPNGGGAQAGSSEASPVPGAPSRAVSHQSASPSGRGPGYGVNKPGPNGYGTSPSGARSHCTKDDPAFINNYYKNSRLHFIGTWRSRYQAMGGGEQWRKGGGKPELPAEGSPAAEKDRLIVHIDMVRKVTVLLPP